jgi:hypothetical protein
MCDIGTINMRFYLLKIPYPHRYCSITQCNNINERPVAAPGNFFRVFSVHYKT